MHELTGIIVTEKEIERVSHKLGEEIEKFQEDEINSVLSKNVIPIKAVPTMYVCIDGTGGCR